MAVEVGFSNLLITGLKTTFPDIQMFGVTTPVDFVSRSNRYALAFRSIMNVPTYVMEGQDSLYKNTLQVDCIGFEFRDAVKLAKAVRNVLSGSWHGTFSDGTVVQGIFLLPSAVDGISEARTFIRSLEVDLFYYEI
jgi:hypothetical protein